MTLDVVIPWRDNGCPHRRAHYQHLRAFYGLHFNVLTGNNPGEFNRAAARNTGVAQSTAPVVAVVDADNLIAPRQLAQAAHRAADADVLVKPFTWFGYLTPQATDDYYQGHTTAIPWAKEPADGLWVDPPGMEFSGGAYVLNRAAWAAVGGFDEQFTGWGGEDDAFTIAATRELGPVEYVPGVAYHLWHPDPGRVTSADNYRRLMEVYVNGNESPGNETVGG
jgi:glycosyltransferase involved in cell wall biosynthesis